MPGQPLERNITGDAKSPVCVFVKRTLFIPADLAMLMAVNGALHALGNSDIWQNIGGSQTEIDAALLMRQMFHTMIDERVVCPMPLFTSVIVAAMSIDDPHWLLCDGAEYNRVDYPDLWAVMPTAMKTVDTFVVPDLRYRLLMGESPEDLVISGNTMGEKEHVLLTSEMPVHDHQVLVRENGSPGSTGNFLGASASGASNTYLTEPEGGGLSHNNMPPVFAIRFYILADPQFDWA